MSRCNRVAASLRLVGYLTVAAVWLALPLPATADEPPTGQQRLQAREREQHNESLERRNRDRLNDAVPKVELLGQVVGPDEQPVEGAHVDAILWQRSSRSRVAHLRADSQADGSFKLDRPAMRYTLHARTADGKMAGITRVDETQSHVTVRVAPTGSVHGRISNRTGVAQGKVQAGTLIYQTDAEKKQSYHVFAPVVTTDNEGRFEISGIIPGERYSLWFLSEAGQRMGRAHAIGKISVSDTKPIDLGEKSYDEPLSLAEKTAEYFRSRSPFPERLKLAGIDARGGYLHLLLVIGEPRGPASERLFEFCDTELAVLNDFIQIPIGSEDTAARAALEAAYGEDVAALTLPALIALDADGKLLGHKSLNLMSHIGSDTRAFIAEHLPPQLDAEKLLADALSQAKSEGKRVFIQESGTYCGPCHLLSRYLDRNKEILGRHFVFLQIDSLRLDNGDKVMKPFHRTANQGIPWVVILDADGNSLGDSEGPDGKNFGFPSAPDGIDRFMQLLATTAPGLAADQLQLLRNDLARKP